MPKRTLLLAAVTLAFSPSIAGAQAVSANEPADLCFRGRPAAHCAVFLLTEFSASSREFGTGRGPEDEWQWDVGAMVNLGARDAVGGTVSFGEPRGGHWGAAGRYRRWLTDDLAVDLSPGFVVVGNDYDGRRLRLTADVGVSAGDWVGLFAHGESSRGGGQAGGGVRLGSWLGAIVGGALYGLLVILPET